MPEREPFTIIDGHPVEETWYSNTVRVALYGADFNSIQAAINYAVTQTPGPLNGWLVLVYPGVYDEQVTMANYVAVRGVGTREETVITHTCAANDEPTVTGADTKLERFTIISDGNAGAWAARCVTNVTNTFIMQDCRFQTQNSVGAADCINSTHGIWILDSIIDQAGGVADAVDLRGGISYIDNCEITGGTNSLHLNTGAVTLNVTKSVLGNRILTAGAVAHVLSVAHTDFFGNHCVLGATGACQYGFDYCEGMANMSDAGLLGAGSLRNCDVAGTGLTVNGTSDWSIMESRLTSITNANAAATVTVNGGHVMTYGGATGSIVWWQNVTMIKVLPVPTSPTDTIIAWACAAAAGGTVTIWLQEGTYNEPGVTLPDDVSLVGINKQECLLDADDVTLITMGANSYVSNLSLDVLTNAGTGIGIECNDKACRIENVIIALHRTAGAMAVGISENTGATARTIHIRNVWIQQNSNTNERGIYINQAGKTIYIEECYIEGSDYGLDVEAASTVHSFSNHYECSSAVDRAVYNDGGTIYLREDDLVEGAYQVAGAGTMVYEDRYAVYHVWPYMSIQNAIDALPATGGKVVLQPGTFTVIASIVMDSYQTLRGSGRSTIITTSVADVDIITATGGAGTEKVGILITELCVDGNAGGVANDIGILWDYVDDSKISHCWVLDCDEEGILLNHSDFNQVIANHVRNCYSNIALWTSLNNVIDGNTCEASHVDDGIYLLNSDHNTITGNTCQGNASNGIHLAPGHGCTVVGNTVRGNLASGIVIDAGERNTITGNPCEGNGSYGIELLGDHNTVSGNGCHRNDLDGIYIGANHNTISGNTCTENSQGTDNTDDNIILVSADYNLVTGNVCRQGVLANQPRYGINVSNAACDKNIIQGNDLHDAGLTANFNDAGTLTIVQEDNREIGVPQVKRYVYMKNTSGGALAAGDVVVFKSGVAAGDEFTTTVVLGDDHVLGMVAEAIGIDAYGYVLIAGKTTLLDVSNVEGAIAIGDFLCCDDTATKAVKAGAGHTTFAIALEACDSAECTLDALLINPLTF